jgi:hypothetical protein
MVFSRRSLKKIAGSGAGSGSVSQRYGCADPDLYQDARDPQHCFLSDGFTFTTGQ